MENDTSQPPAPADPSSTDTPTARENDTSQPPAPADPSADTSTPMETGETDVSANNTVEAQKNELAVETPKEPDVEGIGGEDRETGEKDGEGAAENENDKKRKRESEDGEEDVAEKEKEGERAKEKDNGVDGTNHGEAGADTAAIEVHGATSSEETTLADDALADIPEVLLKNGRVPGKSCANCRAIRKRCDGRQRSCLRKAQIAAYYANMNMQPPSTPPGVERHGMPRDSVPIPPRSVNRPTGLHPALAFLSQVVEDMSGKRIKKKLKDQIPLINDILVQQDVQIRQLQSYLAVQGQYMSSAQGRSMMGDFGRGREPAKKKRKVIEVVDLEAPPKRPQPSPAPFTYQPPSASTEWTYVPRPGAFIKKTKRKKRDLKKTPPSSPGSPSPPASKTPTPKKVVSFYDLPRPTNTTVNPALARPKHVPTPARVPTHIPQFWQKPTPRLIAPTGPVVNATPVAERPSNPSPASSGPRTKAARKMAASS
eukprot:comp23209_c0_seq1/m.37725 comp23209_c0_seq1/g.37725  ORF comp23209_c0_seq1/g.37725 comp23209_c0_seq1/m.37725 type:complete len:484 (-) comp23209_c0_seq1:646-2097(-)